MNLIGKNLIHDKSCDLNIISSWTPKNISLQISLQSRNFQIWMMADQRGSIYTWKQLAQLKAGWFFLLSFVWPWEQSLR